MKLRNLAVLAVGSTLSFAACTADDAGRLSGVTVAAADPGPDLDEDDRWIVTVELDDARVEGDSLVRVAFYGDQLDCAEGDVAISPGDIAAGAAIVFTRVGRDVDSTSPPTIAGTDVDVEC
ncbi:MAG: hypothetical protein RIE08_12835 [Acidimicrobiales bacterium]